MSEYFTSDYLQGRYMNDRVEMELDQFKAEINKKFNLSLLKDFKYPLIEKKIITERGNSTEEAVVVVN